MSSTSNITHQDPVGSSETTPTPTKPNPTEEKVSDSVTPKLDPKVIDSSCCLKQGYMKKWELITGCNTVQLISVIIAVASLLFLGFSIAYAAGFMPPETFIGPIGASVFPITGGLLVFFSGLLVYCSFRTPNINGEQRVFI